MICGELAHCSEFHASPRAIRRTWGLLGAALASWIRELTVSHDGRYFPLSLKQLFLRQAEGFVKAHKKWTSLLSTMTEDFEHCTESYKEAGKG